MVLCHAVCVICVSGRLSSVSGGVRRADNKECIMRNAVMVMGQSVMKA